LGRVSRSRDVADACLNEASVGEAGVRTVAPGFEPGVQSLPIFGSPLQRARESFLSPAKAGSQNKSAFEIPRLKAGGYGSYAGFADELGA